MSRPFQFQNCDGTFACQLLSLVHRLNRKLGDLQPCRQLYYNNRLKNYVLRVLQPGHHEHLSELGPYYFKYLIGLGDHINLWTPAERLVQPKSVMTREGQLYHQERLPRELQFHVLSQVLMDAMKVIEANGFMAVPAPVGPAATAAEFVTGAVTAHPVSRIGGENWTTPDEDEAEAEGN